MADMPEYLSELGYAAGRLEPDAIVDVANKAGQQLGIDNVVRFFFRPYLYLDEAKISAAKLELAEVERVIADALTDMEGIELAVSARNMNKYGGHTLVEQVQKNQHVTRSGDIYIAQQPYWFLFDIGPVVAMHGSPWRYDTHVPVIFSGPGIDAQHIARRVHPVDVAPTMAALLGMSPPAASNGSALIELLHHD